MGTPEEQTEGADLQSALRKGAGELSEVGRGGETERGTSVSDSPLCGLGGPWAPRRLQSPSLSPDNPASQWAPMGQRSCLQQTQRETQRALLC